MTGPGLKADAIQFRDRHANERGRTTGPASPSELGREASPARRVNERTVAIEPVSRSSAVKRIGSGRGRCPTAPISNQSAHGTGCWRDPESPNGATL